MPRTPQPRSFNAPVGIAFRETMAGAFALDVTDPQAGARCATKLAMHAAVEIDDVAAFVRDPRHEAKLTGTIEFGPWREPLKATRGRFALFAPSSEPALTYMVYELGFERAGKPYYLAGKKHVRIGNPLKLWRETTTLYTTLHEGFNARGPVVGAGVLQLGVSDLVRLLSTLEATRAPDLRAKLRAVGGFFRFFASELIRTYILRRPLKAARGTRGLS